MESFLDISSLDISSFDISSFDISSLDISSLDISSLDISSLDISSLDISSLDISSLDISQKDRTNALTFQVRSGTMMAAAATARFSPKEIQPPTIRVIPMNWQTNKVEEVFSFGRLISPKTRTTASLGCKTLSMMENLQRKND
ncbi:hypothetical protein BV898_09078 [Hypsibius exemplaris]|uniref:Uncharacterized protein n=1 Tax=Hypsibius exemplaris TaxID=2072580 RepID=A0A1W0WNY1_HYPEX|nr:hypothetical protein BV898_09078 [Hypsibius exemplaris]